MLLTLKGDSSKTNRPATREPLIAGLDTLTRDQLTDAVERMTLALARATGADVAVICLSFGIPIPTDPR